MSRNKHCISLKSEGRSWNKSLRATDLKRAFGKISGRSASRLLGNNNIEIGFFYHSRSVKLFPNTRSSDTNKKEGIVYWAQNKSKFSGPTSSNSPQKWQGPKNYCSSGPTPMAHEMDGG